MSSVEQAEEIQRATRDQDHCPRYLWDMPCLREAWMRMHRQNKNFMAVIVGDTGEGKSWSGARICELLDPEFDAEKQVAFSVEEFVELVNDDSQGQGSMIMMDEAGVSMDNRTWYDQDQIEVGHILETWRHQNRGAIWTLPTFEHMDMKARRRMHALLVPQSLKESTSENKVKFYWLDTDNQTGDIRRRFQRTQTRGITKVHENVFLTPPSPPVLRAYEGKKDQFTTDLNEQIQENVNKSEEDDIGPSSKEKKKRNVEQEIAEELIEGDFSKVIGENGNTGAPMIDADLVAIEYPTLTQRGAKRVAKLVEREVELE